MPFNGSGTFVRIYNWVNDAANGIKILATRCDAEDDGFAAGLSNCITRDGQGKPTAAINWNGQNLSGVATFGATGLATLAGGTTTTTLTATGLATLSLGATVTGAPLLSGTAASQVIGGVTTGNFCVSTSTSTRWAGGFLNTAASNPFGIAIYYTAAAPNSASLPFFYCVDSVAIRAQVYSNGGLANYSANNVNLSDEREKQDIEAFDAAADLDAFLAFDIYNYRYTDQSDEDLNLGVVAQRLRDSDPRNERFVDPDSWQTLGGEARMSVYDGDLHYRTMAQAQHAHRLIRTLAAGLADAQARLAAAGL